MKKLDDMPIKEFIKLSTQKLDGISCLIALSILTIISILGLLTNIAIGRHSGIYLTSTAAGLLPITIIFYISLTYFSSAGKISEILNSILLLAVPALFLYHA